MPTTFTTTRPGNPTADVNRLPVIAAGLLAVVLAVACVALFAGGDRTTVDSRQSSPPVGAALVDRGPELGTVSSPRAQIVGAAAVDRGPELGTVPPQQSGVSPMAARAEGIASLTGR